MSTSEHEAFAAAAQARRIDPTMLRPALREWLAGRLGAASLELAEFRYPVGAGTSSETILTSAEWSAGGVTHQRDVVFRMQPGGFQLFREPDFRMQSRVFEALHRGGHARVPEPLYYEHDRSVIGLEFYVMEQLKGRVPVTSPPYNAKGWLFDATPVQRRALWESALRELCRIATVPATDVAFLAQPELGPTGLEQQLEYWRQSIDWSTGGETPDVYWALYDWLLAHLPAGRDGMAWGDARIGNMMFGEDFRLTGVMDWEQANLGGPHQDLGWWLYFDHFHTVGRGLTRLDGMGTREETIALWEELVGRPAGDLTWYEVFAGFKVALLVVRTYVLLGNPDARSGRLNPGLPRACELAGIEVGP
jgi:aminoglycoside phosphotransferase (APT) family kinase protein